MCPLTRRSSPHRRRPTLRETLLSSSSTFSSGPSLQRPTTPLHPPLRQDVEVAAGSPTPGGGNEGQGGCFLRIWSVNDCASWPKGRVKWETRGSKGRGGRRGRMGLLLIPAPPSEEARHPRAHRKREFNISVPSSVCFWFYLYTRG